MSLIQRLTTWASGQLLKSADLNGEFNNIVNLLNNLDAATTSWTNIAITGLNNNRIFISSGGKIVEQSAQTSGRIIIADSNGLPISTGAGALNGNLSFVTTSSQGVVGTTTNDSPAAGNVGEYISSSSTTGTNAPTSAQFGDLTSISLTAGDWIVSGFIFWTGAGATWTRADIGISTTTGNSTSGLTDGDTGCDFNFASTSTAIVSFPLFVPQKRFSLSATTTVYLKYSATYSAGGPPTAKGRISATRAR